jgi:chromosomal replication initiation ATPase DnaA
MEIAQMHGTRMLREGNLGQGQAWDNPQTSIGRSADTATRLSDALFRARREGFQALAALPSNIRAIETGLLFAGGMRTFAAIVGPSGWGKSRIVEAVASCLWRESGIPVAVHSALEWAQAPMRTETSSPVILDNAQDVLSRQRIRGLMRMKLDRRVRWGRPTLLAFTSTRITHTIKSLLPRLRDWEISLIQEPTPDERAAVVREIAVALGVQLSPTMVRVLARYIEGNGRTVLGAMQRLKLVRSTWHTNCDMLSALGILQPYLSESSGFDLRDHIHEAVMRTYRSNPELANLAPPDDIALHLMMNAVGLSEGDVAGYYRLSPGEAYARALATKQKLAESPRHDPCEAFVQAILRGLQ